jgi:hypothetical protein
LLISFSCEETELLLSLVKCSDCTTDEPTKAELEIKIDLNKFAEREIFIYLGNLEDNILYAKYKVNSATTSFTVPLNEKFTVTAAYYVDGKNYIVVDSAFPRVKYDKESCQEPCYFVYDNKVNLKLKYTK